MNKLDIDSRLALRSLYNAVVLSWNASEWPQPEMDHAEVVLKRIAEEEER